MPTPTRRNHPWHSMCSYLGTFPPAMANTFIQALSDEGDVVMDPFSGRGTTLLETRVLNRYPIASDLNPLAIALTRAKNTSVPLLHLFERIDELERGFNLSIYLAEANSQSLDIQLIYHPHTLAQLCYLRRRLLKSERQVDHFLIGSVLGIMHGNERKDGTSAYASISMPNTFSMSPQYVRRFVQEKQLQRVERNVFDLLRDKIHRLNKNIFKIGDSGIAIQTDSTAVGQHRSLQEYTGKVNLVFTSPPYLGVVNYALQNWIRMWFLDQNVRNVDSTLSDNLSISDWLRFMDKTIESLESVLADNGIIAMVIGDVSKSKTSVISPARELIRHLMETSRFDYIGCLNDHLDTDVKVSRIWGDAKGKATNVDRIVVLSRDTPAFRGGEISGALPSSRALSEFAKFFAGD